MARPPLIWPITAALTAIVTFYGVRAALAPAIGGFLAVPLGIEMDSSGTAQAGPAEEGDPLLKRLRFLDRLSSAAPSGLRHLLDSGDTSRHEKRLVAQRWAETDPAGLLAWLEGRTRTEWDRDPDQWNTCGEILFRTWAGQDPDAALTAADGLVHQFQKARWQIVRTLFEKDPAKAFAAAVKLPRYQREDEVGEAAWKNDPAAFLTAAGSAPRGAFRNEQVHKAVNNAFGEWVKQDPAAAAAWLKARPLEQQKKLWK